MQWSVPPDEATVTLFGELLEAHEPLIVCDDSEEERIISLIDRAGTDLGIPVIEWRAHVGLSKPDHDQPIQGTIDPIHAVAFIEAANRETIYHLRGFDEALRDARVVSRMKDVCRQLQAHRGAVVLSGPSIDLPRELSPYAHHFTLPAPTRAEYYAVISGVVTEFGATREVTVDLPEGDLEDLYGQLRGLGLAETRRILSRGIAKDGKLSREDLEQVVLAKRQVLEQTGVLSYVASGVALENIGGLGAFKEWIRRRARAFREPLLAKAFGVSAARGVLLIGVQGCGKSLAAKAVAGEWQVPLVRLDPASLFSKYVGETEKSLRRALQTVEAMAPLVLWVDELEKAFSDSRDNDGGVTKRLLGSLLSWLQEHKAPVFIVATANDVQSMPPELLRKGRFDEIFFVDLPNDAVRKELFSIHLAARGRILDEEGLVRLAGATDGFSGAEIEQVIVAALQAAFSAGTELSAAAMLEEASQTRPLSVTMSERIDELRAWADGRAVRAD